MRRVGWNNKSHHHKKGGFYEIVCPVCKSLNRFVIEPNELPMFKSEYGKRLLATPYYLAKKLDVMTIDECPAFRHAGNLLKEGD